MRISDNPACSDGPPLEIGVSISRSGPIDIDEYERTRRPRRHLLELKLCRFQREELLMENGYSRAEIDEVPERIKRQKEKVCERSRFESFLSAARGLTWNGRYKEKRKESAVDKISSMPSVTKKEALSLRRKSLTPTEEYMLRRHPMIPSRRLSALAA